METSLRVADQLPITFKKAKENQTIAAEVILARSGIATYPSHGIFSSVLYSAIDLLTDLLATNAKDGRSNVTGISPASDAETYPSNAFMPRTAVRPVSEILSTSIEPYYV